MATPTTLPATFVAGDVLTALQMNNLRGAFRILQVVEGTTTTSTTSSTTTYADTNLTASITPSSTSSKVLVLVVHNGNYKSSGNTQNGINIRLVRGATTLETWGDIYFTSSALDFYGPGIFLQYLDSPATTSATTYKTQFANRTAAGTVGMQNNANKSSIILMEVSA